MRRADVAVDRRVRPLGRRQAVNGVEAAAIIVSVGLFFYLTAALVKPEWFE